MIEFVVAVVEFVNAAPVVRWVLADPLGALLCVPWFLLAGFVFTVMAATAAVDVLEWLGVDI